MIGYPYILRPCWCVTNRGQIFPGFALGMEADTGPALKDCAV